MEKFFLPPSRGWGHRSLRRTLVLYRQCEASEAISCRALCYAAFMLCQEIASFLAMTMYDPKVQVSDTTGDDSSNAVGIKKIILHLRQLIKTVAATKYLILWKQVLR